MTDEVGKKGCDWLTANADPEKTINRFKYCERTFEGRTVRDHCVKSCNMCFESYAESPSASPDSAACLLGLGGVDCETPICTSPCEHGTCTGPNSCTCDTGYNLPTCNTYNCDASPCGAHGTCTGPNSCTCDTGYTAGNTSCDPICTNECDVNEVCSAPNVCSCAAGDSSCELGSPGIALGSCEDVAVMAGTAATCGGSVCTIVEGKLGVSSGVTSITGNFDATILSKEASDNCAEDGLAAWETGMAMTGTTKLDAEIGGMTFTPGVYVYGLSTNVALSVTVYLDAKGVSNAQFVFNIGTTLTTSAKSKVVLLNGAMAENVFWVLGTALIMGADSVLVGNVLAGSSITMGTNAKISGRAIAQAAITCATACTVG